ncbi:hypothetical protein [Bacteroides cellulosilyticus]
MVWCVAAPFFIGSISRGRTIRQNSSKPPPDYLYEYLQLYHKCLWALDFL